MNSDGGWRLGHRPALDGLRGVAVLMVMCGHVWPAHAQIAMAGVGVFFTLSGFLITSLLLEERAATGGVRLGAFFKRRALRLLPAVFAFLTVGVALGYVTVGQAVPVVLYVENWSVIVTGWPSYVLHCWSLSVEEQFYVLWPLLLLLVAKAGRRVLLGFTIAGAVASAVWGLVLVGQGASAYRVAYGSDTNAVALLAGCGLAVFLFGGPVRRARPVLALAALVTVSGCLLVHSRWQLPLVPVLAAVAIYGLAAGNVPAWVAPRWLVLVGRRSYALYLWSTPLAFEQLLTPLRGYSPDWIAVPIFFAVSWVVATASWHLVERPFLRLKERQASRSRTAKAGTPVARVVVPDPPALNI